MSWWIFWALIVTGSSRGEQVNSTKVRADADIDSLSSRYLVENHLDELFEELADAGTLKAETPPVTPPAALSTAENRELFEENHGTNDWISRAGRQDRTFVSGTRKRTADLRVSRTDPDATPMRTGAGETKLGYQAHYVVDGGKARIVVGALVAPAEVSENRPMLYLLWRTVFRWKLRPRHVVADGIYGTVENVAAVKRAGVRAYLSLHEAGGKPAFGWPVVAFRASALYAELLAGVSHGVLQDMNSRLGSEAFVYGVNPHPMPRANPCIMLYEGEGVTTIPR